MKHTGLALALAGALTTLTACTGPSGSDGDDAKPGDDSSSASAAPPGKYRTLPEPCGTVSISQLKDMLPGAEAADDGSDGDSDSGSVDPSPSPFKGEATVTYDTDRRVGCRWKNATTLGTRHLNVDFERVVSYDPAVSDDEQAERLYDKKASKAEIPVTSDGASGQSEAPGEGESPGGATPDGKTSADGASSGGAKDDSATKRNHRSPESSDEGNASEGEGSSPSPEGELAPRPLDGIGDTAFINDKLDTEDSGLHRDVTLVFRTANVIATVRYDQWVTDKHRIPDSKELQDKTHDLAVQLAETFEEE
ncbi:hypothetical protein [Streptomyces axinellae]|uniref:hypothetical protein n=1 Tax=Streptomyces axinellae TaxID=552788 RepID=UPI0031CE8713